MSGGLVSLASVPSMLQLAASTVLVGITVTGPASTLYVGAPGRNLLSTGNIWLPAVETLTFGVPTNRRTAASSSVHVCGSQHGSMRVPTGLTLVALLNCTLANNTAYASATSALAFATGSYWEFEAVTSASKPLYTDALAMASNVQATVYVSESAVPFTLKLAVFANSGGCAVASVFTVQGCPKGAMCSVTTEGPTSDDLCGGGGRGHCPWPSEGEGQRCVHRVIVGPALSVQW